MNCYSKLMWHARATFFVLFLWVLTTDLSVCQSHQWHLPQSLSFRHVHHEVTWPGGILGKEITSKPHLQSFFSFLFLAIWCDTSKRRFIYPSWLIQITFWLTIFIVLIVHLMCSVTYYITNSYKVWHFNYIYPVAFTSQYS